MSRGQGPERAFLSYLSALLKLLVGPSLLFLLLSLLRLHIFSKGLPGQKRGKARTCYTRSTS